MIVFDEKYDLYPYKTQIGTIKCRYGTIKCWYVIEFKIKHEYVRLARKKQIEIV